MIDVVDIHHTVSKLKSSGEAFALATVVRTISVTSAKTGAKAVIMADGSISEGWIGGGCARAAVLNAAKEVIADGTTRLVSIQPEELLREQELESGVTKNGVKFATNMCPSQGTMDIFVEAILPRPELVIFGASPVAIALAALAKPMGFTTTICADAPEHDKFHYGDKFVDGLSYETNTNNKRYVIISTQGRGDQASLESALSLNAEFVAFVGSRKKAEKLKGNLAANGISQENLDTIKAPAGLDINAITPEEIALSILAELTQFRRADQYQSFRSDNN